MLFGVIVLSIGLSAKLLLFPLLEDRKSVEESIQAKTALLNKYNAALKKKPELERRRGILKEKIATLEPLLFTEEFPALVSAALQSTLERMIKQRGGAIKSMKTLKSEDLGNYAKIWVEIIFTSEIRPFLDVLYDMAEHPKSLSIVKMDVHFQERKARQKLRILIKVEAGMENKTHKDSLNKNILSIRVTKEERKTFDV